jgi:hypothetical protein
VETLAGLWAFVVDNEGGLLFVATLLLALLTLLLVRESRAGRLSATVVATPHLWAFNEDVLAVDLENVGPAPAHRIEVGFTWHGQAGEIVAHWRRELAALGPGRTVAYHPDTLLRDDDGGHALGVASLADRLLTLKMTWRWSDSRRPWWWFGRLRHRGALEVVMSEFRSAMHGAPNTIDPDAIDRLLRGLREMGDRRRREESLRTPSNSLPAEIRVAIEADELRERAQLWIARLRYWVLRQRR